VRVYWSHCGTYRLARWQAMKIPRVKSLQDVVNLGKEVREKGWTALKTNPMILNVDEPYQHAPGFARRQRDFPELNADRHVLSNVRDQLAAFREGAGKDVDILVDLNFNFKTEGFIRMARAMEPFDLLWVEIDTRDPKALHYIRSKINIPVASCECLFGRRDYRPYFESQSVDVAIVDTPWNGVGESVKVANMADTYEVNVAPHNFYGWLSTCMNAHFCAVVPNLRIMEIDPDVVPWYDELVTKVPKNENGGLVEFSADLSLLVPVDRARASGRALIDVVNRGNTVSVPNFNHATRPAFTAGSDPNPPIDVGDGFLMRRGYVVASCGWQFDLPDVPGLIRLHGVEAREQGQPLRGRVYVQLQAPEDVADFLLSDRAHHAYAAADLDERDA